MSRKKATPPPVKPRDSAPWELDTPETTEIEGQAHMSETIEYEIGELHAGRGETALHTLLELREQLHTLRDNIITQSREVAALTAYADELKEAVADVMDELTEARTIRDVLECSQAAPPRAWERAALAAGNYDEAAVKAALGFAS